jgi:hypothetical protein
MVAPSGVVRATGPSASPLSGSTNDAGWREKMRERVTSHALPCRRVSPPACHVAEGSGVSSGLQQSDMERPGGQGVATSVGGGLMEPNVALPEALADEPRTSRERCSAGRDRRPRARAGGQVVARWC